MKNMEKNVETKCSIREKILSLRGEMDPLQREEKNGKIAGTVIVHPWFLEADTVYCYMDFRGEAGTEAIMEAAFAAGKKVAVPRTAGDAMDFYYIRSRRETAPGNFQVMEPVGVEKADGESGLIIVPGAVFDRKLGRIGYGKGYYDRYLREHPGLKTMGIAYDLQVQEELPQEEHDIRLQLLVTESGILSPECGDILEQE